MPLTIHAGMFIAPINGGIWDGLLLFYQHYILCRSSDCETSMNLKAWSDHRHRLWQVRGHPNDHKAMHSLVEDILAEGRRAWFLTSLRKVRRAKKVDGVETGQKSLVPVGDHEFFVD